MSGTPDRSAPSSRRRSRGWLCDLVGLPAGSWGVLTSGGVMANLMALAVAREVHLRALLDLDRAPRGADLEGVRVYASDQTHFSVGRGLDILGFPEGTLRVVPSDAEFRLQAGPVAAAIEADRAAGLTPLAVCAVAGSTNTGSVDDVPGLASLARAEGCWLHVDAAYGGAVRLSRRDGARVPGLELADSITIDPHKWFFQAYDIGALVVRRRQDLLDTFHRAPEYYASNRPEDAPLNYYEYSVEGTRRFRALKLWMSWQHLGTDGSRRARRAHHRPGGLAGDDAPGGARFRARVRPRVVGRLLPPSPRRFGGLDAGPARRIRERVAARARSGRRRLGERHDPARAHVPPRGHRELPGDPNRRRCAGRGPSTAVRRRPRRPRPRLTRRA